jgi:hypothetical protein
MDGSEQRVRHRILLPAVPIVSTQQRVPQRATPGTANETEHTMPQTHREVVICRAIQDFKDLAARGVRIFNLRIQVDGELHQAGMAGLSDADCAAHAELANPDWRPGKVLMSVSQRVKVIRGAVDEFLRERQTNTTICSLRTHVNGMLRDLDQPPLTAVEIDADPFLADEEYGKGFPSRNRRLVALSKRREDTEASRAQIEEERQAIFNQALEEWKAGFDSQGARITGTLETYVNAILEEAGLPRLTKEEAAELDAKLPDEMR